MRFKEKIKRINNNNKGFTLVELLISIILLTIIIGAFLSVFEFVTRNNIQSAEIVDEGYVAQTYMEKVISWNNQDTDWPTTITNIGSEYSNYIGPDPSGTSPAHTFTKQEDNFNIETVITEKIYTIPGEASENENLVRVEVSVYKDSTYNDLVASVQNIISK